MADSSAAGSTEQETALLDAKSKKALFEAKIAEQSKKSRPSRRDGGGEEEARVCKEEKPLPGDGGQRETYKG